MSEKGRIEFTDADFRPRRKPNLIEAAERFIEVNGPFWKGGFTLVELQDQKEWFTDLKDAIERDDKEIALQLVQAALLLLDRQMNER